MDELPLDWTNERTRSVHGLLVEAYPFNADALILAKNSGLRVQTLDQMAPVDRLVREILEKARLADRLPHVLAEVFTDPSPWRPSTSGCRGWSRGAFLPSGSCHPAGFREGLC